MYVLHWVSNFNRSLHPTYGSDVVPASYRLQPTDPAHIQLNHHRQTMVYNDAAASLIDQFTRGAREATLTIQMFNMQFTIEPKYSRGPQLVEYANPYVDSGSHYWKPEMPHELRLANVQLDKPDRDWVLKPPQFNEHKDFWRGLHEERQNARDRELVSRYNPTTDPNDQMTSQSRSKAYWRTIREQHQRNHDAEVVSRYKESDQ